MALDEKTLSQLLEAAVADSPSLDDLGFSAALQLGQRDKLPASLQALFAYIDATPELALFRGGTYFLAGSGGTASPDRLIVFLLMRAVNESPAVAVTYLTRYLAATEIPCIRRTIMMGVVAGAPVNLNANTRFIPWGQYQDDGDPILKQESDRLNANYGFARPTGVLDARITIPTVHVAAGVPVPEVKLPDETSDARAPVMALQLVCPNAVFGPITWHHFPRWVFGAPSGTRYFQPLPDRTGFHKLTDEDIAEAQALHGKLAALPPSALDPLWPAVHRLSLAQSHMQPVEDAIDLRVAYEMTFFFGDDGGYQGELKFRLAMLAARLLGKTYAEREEISAVGNDLYDMSSGAIHAGRIKQKYAKNAHEVLGRGAAVVRKGLKHIVLNGAPDWKRLLLE